MAAGVDRGSGATIWADLSYYPALLLLYAGGMGSIVGERYDTLKALLLGPRLLHHNRWHPAVEVLLPHTIMDPRQAERVAGLPQTFSPFSDRLATVLRSVLLDLVPDDAAFEQLFDRFEYLLGLIHLDMTRTADHAWGPVGRFGAAQYGTGIDGWIEEEIKAAQATWGPLAAGLFGGSAERLEESLTAWKTHLEAVRRESRFRQLR